MRPDERGRAPGPGGEMRESFLKLDAVAGLPAAEQERLWAQYLKSLRGLLKRLYRAEGTTRPREAD